ncbi:MAG: aspartate aminotransferase family protein [Acidimicrobiia bacterium]|nr:aspartate aminotransferase family protein [Acidimicrobiia bacterium]
MAYPDPTSRSAALYERGRACIPDGLSRSLALIRPHPIYVASGEGAWVTDVDGRRYFDANNNFTSIILGHGDPAVAEAVARQVSRGTAFAMGTEAEIELAEILCDRVPSIDKVRFCNSGTEAVMGAIKAARAFTGRPMIAKIEGAYHGTYDHAETSLGAGPDTWGPADAPASVLYAAGTPTSVGEEVAVVPFNDAGAARSIIDRHGEKLAAVLIDTLPSRVGLPIVDRDFLDAVFSAAHAVGALVIMDEVITFRLGYAGNQGRLEVEPDLTTLAKIIGGGFPVGAIGGRADVMDVFAAPAGGRAPLPAGGTFSANPVTMVAGAACLNQLDERSFQRLDDIGEGVRQGVRAGFERLGIPWQVTGAGSLFRLHPHQRPIRSYRDAHLDDGEAATMDRLQKLLLEREVYLPGYGLGCLNLATSDADVAHLVGAISDAVAAAAT